MTSLLVGAYLLLGFGFASLIEAFVDKNPPRILLIVVWPVMLMACAVLPIETIKKLEL